MNEFVTLVSDRGVQLYFLVLGWAVWSCTSRYYVGLPAASKKSEEKTKTNRLIYPSPLPIVVSLLIVGVTWFYIFRFILTNQHTSESYFDDAYKDVLRGGHYGTSAQLLTWAVVAVLWTDGAHLCWLSFGMLGAMSAAFALWVPSLHHERADQATSREKIHTRIPVCYIFSSTIAFLCIINLLPCADDEIGCTEDKGFGSFQTSFRFWLHSLHIILILPMYTSRLFPSQPKVDAALLYALLAVATFGWHLSWMLGRDEGTPVFARPITDCQISITMDLLCCTCITLYAIYRDNLILALSKVTDKSVTENDAARRTLIKVSVAALAVPLISPATVLAVHLFLRSYKESHGKLVAFLQQQVARKLRNQHENRAENGDTNGDSDENDTENGNKTWCNLGLWAAVKKDAIESKQSCVLRSYDEACEELALALGDQALLNESDTVLCCGCGSGVELKFYKDRFKLRHITGIDQHVAEKQYADFNIRQVQASVEVLNVGNRRGATKLMFPPSYFNTVLALDNVYHYPSKMNFFQDCADLLPPGGKIAVTDILVSKDVPYWVRWILLAMGIPSCNMWTADEYRSRLSSLGFVNTEITLIGTEVFCGWRQLLTGRLLKHLDYGIIVSMLPPKKEGQLRTKKRVAIIGAGMAGLTASHALTTSSKASEISVTLFEANPNPGLAGNTTCIESQLVDVPARMNHSTYYTHFRDLVESLGIKLKGVRTDCAYYGDDGEGGRVLHKYEMSMLSNFVGGIFNGRILETKELLKALSNTNEKDIGCSKQVFGDWIAKHFVLKSGSTKSQNGTDSHVPHHDLLSLVCSGNPLLYMTISSLCWMLSCTYDQLAGYPISIVLPYLRECVDGSVVFAREGRVARVDPSIQILQHKLMYGVERLHCNTRVVDLDQNKVINGVKYDAIICATEAQAVPRVVQTNAEVFSKIKYHPSLIYLHTDASFMPPNKKDWRCWNVEQKVGQDQPQLTFWLNAFYDQKWEKDIFQTWAPLHTPKQELTIKKFDMQRVVHTEKSDEWVKQIEAEQGKDGIYFAGSYCEYGMGLLEEASISGRKAANAVLSDIFSPEKNNC